MRVGEKATYTFNYNKLQAVLVRLSSARERRAALDQQVQYLEGLATDLERVVNRIAPPVSAEPPPSSPPAKSAVLSFDELAKLRVEVGAWPSEAALFEILDAQDRGEPIDYTFVVPPDDVHAPYDFERYNYEVLVKSRWNRQRADERVRAHQAEQQARWQRSRTTQELMADARRDAEPLVAG